MWNAIEEEIKKYLLEKDINIYKRNYKMSENYKRIENERIIGCSEFGSMSLDEFIERFLLTKKEVNNKYESIYDMGNVQELTDDQCEDISVAREIITMHTFIEEMDVDAEAVEFVQKFYRKGGLLERLDKYLQIDLDAVDKNNKRYKRERCKILYFFYMLEHEIFEGYNVLKLLSRPSMESIDNAALNIETRNGIVIKAIKDSVEKELSLSSKEKIKGAVSKIVNRWDSIMENAYYLMDFFYKKERKYDFYSTIQPLLSESEEMQISQTSYYVTLSPIEMLYLKIIQHEYMGNVKDIIQINNIQKKYNYNVSSELIEEMKKLHYSVIDISNVEQYIDDNAERLSRYVYLGKRVNKDDIRRIRNTKKKVCKWLDFCVRVKPLLDINTISNELQIVSFLQAVIIDDADEIFDYTFYRYEKDASHKKPRVQAALKNDGYVPHALKCYWVRKVTDHWYANIGRYEERLTLRKLENACDSVLEKILSENGLDKMESISEFYLDKIDDGLLTTKEQIQAVQCFEKYINDKGFIYIDGYYLIRYIFLYPPEIRNTYAVVTKLIDYSIKENKSCLEVSVPEHSANGKDDLKCDILFKFDYHRKECFLEDINLS